MQYIRPAPDPPYDGPAREQALERGDRSQSNECRRSTSPREVTPGLHDPARSVPLIGLVKYASFEDRPAGLGSSCLLAAYWTGSSPRAVRATFTPAHPTSNVRQAEALQRLGLTKPETSQSSRARTMDGPI